MIQRLLNYKMDSYLTLSEEGLKKTEKKAKEQSKSSFGDDNEGSELVYEDCSWNIDEISFDKDNSYLDLSGNISFSGVKIGYFSPKIVLDDETVIEIIEHYRKKLGKLKTVFEAIKD